MKFSFGKIAILIACLIFFSTGWSQTRIISGKVTSGEGAPLSGVSVTISGTTNGTATDSNGEYSINATTGNILNFSSVGFINQDITVGSSSTINVTLLPSVADKLSEVVLIGYGTQKKSSLTGAVTSISTKQMQNQIGASVASTLQGLAPGVEILQPGGIAGANANILIRGAGTFGSTAPLYVIDGAFSNSALNNLNPNDIESIEVLKDASAAAIYGSRAANGVVLITTKKGTKGPAIINFNAFFALQTPAKLLKFMNAGQYRSFMNQVADNSGIAHAPQNDNPTNPDVSTDWQKAGLQNAPMYSGNLSVSGGGENSTYNLSLGYLNQEGLTVFTGYKKYDFRANNSFKKGRFSINESFSLSRQETRPNISSAFGAPVGIPTLPVTDGKGNYISGTPDYYLQNAIVSNPLVGLGYNINSRVTLNEVNNTFLIGSININFNILPGFDYRFTMGGSYNDMNNFVHAPVFYTLYNADGVGLSSYGRNINSISEKRGGQLNYNIDNLLSYKKQLKKHNIDLLLGTSWLRDKLRTDAINTITDLGAPNISGTNGTITGQINALEQQSALLSYFSRINYDFDERYLLSVSVRNDISSKFAKAYRSGWFPSVSAGWNLHKEDWFNNKNISQLKIRASYGELGANFIDPYQFNNTLLGPVPSPFGMTPTNSISSYVVQLFPLNLKWETSVSKDIGFDLGLFGNKLTFTVDLYNKTNKNLLASVAAPPSSGQGLTQSAEGSRLVPVNTASVQNKGIEFSAGFNKNQGAFQFNITGNLTFLRNKVLKLGDNIPPILGPVMSGNIGDNITITEAGYPIGSFYGFQMVGLTDSGTIKISGFDGAGNKIAKSIDQGGPEDKGVIGSPYPDFSYGVNFSGNFKNFDFVLFIQGVQGGDILNQTKLNTYFNYNQNLVSDVLNSWTPTHTNTNIPKASTELTAISARPSTFFIEDGSYLRLKNFQIGYNVNTTIFSRGLIKNMRVYIGVQNLFTITKYTGYDPEVGSPSISGRNTDMTTITRNVDLASYPNSRTFTIGINTSF